MMAKVKDILWSVGENTACYAGWVGDRTSALARRVGPKRGGIALGVVAAAVATPFVIRYVRSRKADAEHGHKAKAPQRRGARHAAPTPHA
jgi:hypothetical protein